MREFGEKETAAANEMIIRLVLKKRKERKRVAGAASALDTHSSLNALYVFICISSSLLISPH